MQQGHEVLPGSSYRKDIQGLRALAILAVVAAHAGMPYMEGGFVGVDMFFVLSGFLITGILYRELQARGKLDLVGFYARRLKRLLPALLLMLFCTALASMVLLAPFEQLAQTEAFVAAALWLSNFHFVVTDAGYFDLGAERNLVLHTWSLAVEEQFYLLWPLLLLGLWGVKGSSIQRLLIGFALVLVISLSACLWLSANLPLWAFYSMPSRAWQFALGALVFLLLQPGKSGFLKAGNLASVAGMSLLLGSVLLIDEAASYPSWRALFPSLGAALLIFGGATSQGNIIGRCLACRPLVVLGDLSYSWYLWHWPVLIIGGTLYPEGALGYRILLAVLSLMIAAGAYYTVEKPLRGNPWLLVNPRLTIGLSLLLMLSISAGVLQWRTLARTWVEYPQQASYQEIRANLPVIYSMNCDGWFQDAEVRVCGFGNMESDRTAVLFGDSVGAQWFTALASYYVSEGWRFLVVTKSSCPLVDEPFFYERIGEYFVLCETWRNQVVENLSLMAPDVLFMGSAATYPYTSEQWTEGTARLLEALAGSVGRIFVVRGTPRLPFDGPGCLARQQWQPGIARDISDCSAPAESLKDSEVLAALKLAISRFPNVRLLDLNPLVCPDDVCMAERDDVMVFRDEQHITDSYVRLIAPPLMQQVLSTE